MKCQGYEDILERNVPRTVRKKNCRSQFAIHSWVLQQDRTKTLNYILAKNLLL